MAREAAEQQQFDAEAAGAREVNKTGAEVAADQTESPVQHEGEAPAAAEQQEEKKVHPRVSRLDQIAASRRRQIEQNIGRTLDAAAPAEGESTVEGEEGEKPAEQPAPEPEPKPKPAKPEQPEPAPQPAQAKKAKPKQQPAAELEPVYEIKVNGKARTLSQEELIRLAQKGLSADERYAEAARLREEAQRLRTTDSSPQPTPTAARAEQQDSGTKPAQPAPVADLAAERKARAAKVAKALQYGEASEAEAAIEELLAAREGRDAATPPPEEIGQVVARALFQRDQSNAYQNALERVGQEYPDLMEDEDLRALAAERTHRERAADIIAQGYDPDEVSALLRTDAGKNQLLQLHMMFQTQGIVRRGHYDVFRAACDGVRQKLGRVRPTQTVAAVSPARQDAKRQLPPSPATAASARSPAPATAPPPSRSSVISGMRRARGQPV